MTEPVTAAYPPDADRGMGNQDDGPVDYVLGGDSFDLMLFVDGTVGITEDGVSAIVRVSAADADVLAVRLSALRTSDAEPVAAALGKDVTPGHDELHHYWTRGPGLARWADSPTPWTTLLANLVEVAKDKPLTTLKKWASAWFIEVKGYAAGSDLNRVAHGKPPRGHLVGPG